MPADEILFEAEEKMEKTLGKIQEEFSAVRTGKASPALVEHIRVNAYGTTMTLREMAGITCPEPRLIMIQPWDISNVDPIRKALEESKLGVNPLIDGKIIRIPIPELSEERRRDLTKVVKRIAEDGKIAIRAIRRDALDRLKKEQKAGDLTEDELATAEKETQKLTDAHGEKIDKAFTAKETELMSV
ncbi:MAG: ribosome recycling factor [Verrucomicrobiales bacterium]|jgi:ribosome recycling factor|nr:ribosome recycling factor [Verrucomicrobiales bacterium]